ncbi:non-heme iron oxygenase ferredoxin subunit [Paraburkholderia caribensis]|uniref:non-heme iron oxygenase ferredoxin subunit n=1 Tax=Paraburkholderia caribensis TaxID=75105 RepID=UPI001CB59AE8|nr:non-heme iron oxygenase ferredoxin subunit [Paraburkholderia caribensis]CAG9263183.1 putative 3-phenylpropionate/cinnamate dioxygenase ferredoxin subunit [Paraburkholderia caribensis]
MTEQRRQVATLDQVEEGETLRVELGDNALCLYRIQGEVYATDDLCTHGQASLADGLIIDGALIECPLHEGAFDIRTGAPARAPCKLALKRYAVHVEDDAVFVEL